MKKLSYTSLLLLTLLASVIAVKTATLPSRQISANGAEPLRFDRELAVARLSAALRLRTVAGQAGDGEAFSALREHLLASFPRLHAALKREVVAQHSLLYTWPGSDPKLKPMLLLAHQDTVPVEPASEPRWSQPPFSGAVSGGFVWGRGAMDDKGSLMAIMEAAEALLAAGFKPARTIYFAFGHDEESGGQNGAAAIAALLKARGVAFEFILDEGMNITDGIISQIDRPVALIGIAEKGYVSLELTVSGTAGHSSTPPARSAIGILSGAIDRLENGPIPTRLSAPTRRMFEFLAPEMAWPHRIALANLWLFGPLVERQFAQSQLTNAVIRTTQAATLFKAGVSENILADRARAVLNYRILPGESIASVTEYVRRVVADPRVKITPLQTQAEPSPVSSVETASFAAIHRAIQQVAPNAVVAPALLVAASDARHYSGLSQNIYRFLPITLKPEDAARYHGVDERISLADYERCIRFYARLMRNAAVPKSALDKSR